MSFLRNLRRLARDDRGAFEPWRVLLPPPTNDPETDDDPSRGGTWSRAPERAPASAWRETHGVDVGSRTLSGLR